MKLPLVRAAHKGIGRLRERTWVTRFGDLPYATEETEDVAKCVPCGCWTADFLVFHSIVTCLDCAEYEE